ncbi:hypothetical protein ACM614_16940 [Streptomyces sp. 12297]
MLLLMLWGLVLRLVLLGSVARLRVGVLVLVLIGVLVLVLLLRVRLRVLAGRLALLPALVLVRVLLTGVRAGVLLLRLVALRERVMWLRLGVLRLLRVLAAVRHLALLGLEAVPSLVPVQRVVRVPGFGA